MATTIRSAWRWTALALLAALALPPALPAQAPPRDLGQIFKDADRNRDGRLDREEFRLLMVETFYLRDKDKNGYLVVTEVTELDAVAFRRGDGNGDGRISLEEYVNAALRDFEAADTDRNGSLAYEEIEIYVRATRR
jgi:Ca2+-binding EF-hand superfamily protein